MNTQQRRPFFQTVKSVVKSPEQRSEPRSRLRGLAVIFAALLLTSCASLTPENRAVILDLVGSALQTGLRIWLGGGFPQPPEATSAVDTVVGELAGLSNRGTPATEAEVAEVLRKLPEGVLKGTTAEVYLSGNNIVLWDARRFEAYEVDRKSAPAVAKAARVALMAGMKPVPPLPERVAAPPRAMAQPQPPLIVYVTNQTVLLVPQAVTPPVVESPTPAPAVPAGKFAPRTGIYRVEKRDGTNWVEVSSFTSGPAEFRVKRVR